jgi:hypothetical protein
LEFAGEPSDNPVLVDSSRFNDFLGSFGLRRSIRGGRSEEFRGLLRGPDFPLEALLSDQTGQLIDEQDKRLRPHFGTITPGSNNRFRSLLGR